MKSLFLDTMLLSPNAGDDGKIKDEGIVLLSLDKQETANEVGVLSLAPHFGGSNPE